MVRGFAGQLGARARRFRIALCASGMTGTGPSFRCCRPDFRHFGAAAPLPSFRPPHPPVIPATPSPRHSGRSEAQSRNLPLTARKTRSPHHEVPDRACARPERRGWDVRSDGEKVVIPATPSPRHSGRSEAQSRNLPLTARKTRSPHHEVPDRACARPERPGWRVRSDGGGASATTGGVRNVGGGASATTGVAGMLWRVAWSSGQESFEGRSRLLDQVGSGLHAQQVAAPGQ